MIEQKFDQVFQRIVRCPSFHLKSHVALSKKLACSIIYNIFSLLSVLFFLQLNKCERSSENVVGFPLNSRLLLVHHKGNRSIKLSRGCVSDSEKNSVNLSYNSVRRACSILSVFFNVSELSLLLDDVDKSMLRAASCSRNNTDANKWNCVLKKNIQYFIHH